MLTEVSVNNTCKHAPHVHLLRYVQCHICVIHFHMLSSWPYLCESLHWEVCYLYASTREIQTIRQPTSGETVGDKWLPNYALILFTLIKKINEQSKITHECLAKNSQKRKYESASLCLRSLSQIERKIWWSCPPVPIFHFQNYWKNFGGFKHQGYTSHVAGRISFWR
jgi:hypothetical protein